MSRNAMFAAVGLGVGFAVRVASGGTFFVAPGGTGAGGGWASPAGSLEDVLASALPGDEVWVKSGTYQPNNASAGTGRSRTFLLAPGVVLRGGFPPTGSPGFASRNPIQYQTTLSGDVLVGDNVYHVVTARSVASDTIVEGFIIRDGLTSGNVTSFRFSTVGPGILCDVAAGGGATTTPVFQSCVIRNNVGTESGAVFVFGDVDPAGPGGPDGSDDGLVSPVFRACEIVENTTSVTGGGIFIETAAAYLTCCVVARNQSGNWGAGIYARYDATLNVTNCTVVKNAVLEGCGGGCVCGGGIAVTAGGFGSSDPTAGQTTILNSIIYYNTVEGDGSSVETQIGVIGACTIGAMDVSFTRIAGGSPAPSFRDLSGGDYRLNQNSPGINDGNPVTSLIPSDSSDVDGDSVFAEPVPDRDRQQRVKPFTTDCNTVLRVDQGAFEYTYCRGDVNGSGEVDATDLAIILGAWGVCGFTCPYDLDGDATVGAVELAIVLGYGSCCELEGQSCECFESMALQQENESSGSFSSPLELAEAMNFQSLQEFADWLSGFPPEAIGQFFGTSPIAPSEP